MQTFGHKVASILATLGVLIVIALVIGGVANFSILQTYNGWCNSHPADHACTPAGKREYFRQLYSEE